MWPDLEDFVWQTPVASPETWGQPGLVMFFNLECPGCVSRGVPFAKRLARHYGDRLNILAVHTSLGHKVYQANEVVPTLQHFARDFAQLPFPVALDLKGNMAKSWQVLGTPHWLMFESGGALFRSIYGSQDNAQTRLTYALEQLLGPGDADL